MAFVIRELGASLLTTVVGLPFRQWLFAYDPAQHDQDSFYRTLEEELRRSAAEFKKSQIELVGLVEQFVEVRKTLFAEEQIASEQYIGNLKRAISMFDDSFGKYPLLISSALDSCTKVFNKMKTKLENLSTAMDNLDSSQLQQLETELQKFKEQTLVLGSSLDMLNRSVAQLTLQAGQIPEAVSQVYGSVSKAAGQGAAELKNNLDVLLRDIQNIDKLLTEFVDMQALKIAGE